MAIIDVHNLSVKRGRQPTLYDINIAIGEAEVFAIIGPSGAGKSTLLRCLNRLEEPGAGQVFLQATDITTLPVIELRRRVGMIFQKPVALEGSVAQNIAYGAGLAGKRLSRERIMELLQLASLETDLIDRDASELSGGQEQRLAIARALANEPDVLLLDEPTSALDPAATHRVEESLLKLRTQLGLTLVWVSHAIEQVRRVADRVVLLEAGRLVRVDTVEKMLDPQTGDKRALAFAAGADDRLNREEE